MKFFQMMVMVVGLAVLGTGCVSSFPVARAVVTNATDDVARLTVNGRPVVNIAPGSWHSEDLLAPYGGHAQYLFVVSGLNSVWQVEWVQDRVFSVRGYASSTVYRSANTGPSRVYSWVVRERR